MRNVPIVLTARFPIDSTLSTQPAAPLYLGQYKIHLLHVHIGRSSAIKFTWAVAGDNREYNNREDNNREVKTEKQKPRSNNREVKTEKQKPRGTNREVKTVNT
jgi:hypothetical protein